MGYTPPMLDIRKSGNAITIFPPNPTTAGSLRIFANGSDFFPNIYLLGLGTININAAAGVGIKIYDGSTQCLTLNYATPDYIIENVINNENIYLKTTGTGKIKFGTYTAGAATDSTGYISIIDAAGNARKLMVQA